MKEMKEKLAKYFDFLEPDLDDWITKGNTIVYSLEGNKDLAIDLVNKTITIRHFVFDMYRDPCPGLVLDREEDVTHSYLSIIEEELNAITN